MDKFTHGTMLYMRTRLGGMSVYKCGYLYFEQLCPYLGDRQSRQEGKQAFSPSGHSKVLQKLKSVHPAK